jgi:protein-L-isoaspartate(D-aspartate) O-methyltransferase
MTRGLVLLAALSSFIQTPTIQTGAFGDRAPERKAMVAQQIAARGITNPAVLEAMRAVPRHLFVPASIRTSAYEDRPLPIGHGQTISQPYIVAYMTDALGVASTHRVLEIGTGSGYQAAILSRLARSVSSIEIVPELGTHAAAVLKGAGYSNVIVRIGDGYAGWPERAPFDRIIVTAAPDHVPEPLVRQLAIGGRMVIPVGPAGGIQELLIIEKTGTGVLEKRTIPVVFVPLTRR